MAYTIEEAKNFTSHDLNKMAYSELVQVNRAYRKSIAGRINAIENFYEGKYLGYRDNAERIEAMKAMFEKSKLPDLKTARKLDKDPRYNDRNSQEKLKIRKEIGAMRDFYNLRSTSLKSIAKDAEDIFETFKELNEEYYDSLSDEEQEEYMEPEESDMYDFLRLYHEIGNIISESEVGTRFSYKGFINYMYMHYTGQVKNKANKPWRYMTYTAKENEVLHDIKSLKNFKHKKELYNYVREYIFDMADPEAQAEAYRKAASGNIGRPKNTDEEDDW